MKISASVYSNKTKSVTELVKELDNYGVDYIHIDCNDNLSVFDDIKAIREVSSTPIDLHIISSEPEKFYPLIHEHKVELVTLQYENIPQHPIHFEKGNTSWGLSVISHTSIEVFESYKEQFDFLLFMTTTPGQSGGTFNKENLKKIRAFRNKYPNKKVHVDGGVNNEIAFVLRNMGVDSVVSGSYLVNADVVGKALHNLRKSGVESNLLVSDIVIEKDELPVLDIETASFKEIVFAIEKYNYGFALLQSNDCKMAGISTGADVRRAIIKNIDSLTNIPLLDVVNTKPAFINENNTVSEMLDKIKELPFSVLFLPVISEDGTLKGVVTFNNLIKGEL